MEGDDPVAGDDGPGEGAWAREQDGLSVPTGVEGGEGGSVDASERTLHKAAAS